MTAAVSQQTPHRRQNVLFAVAVFFCCMALTTTPAAAVQWNRVGVVTTLTNGQLCKTDGTNVVCDSTTPTIASGLVGIGTTSPSQLLTVGGNIDITGSGFGYLTEIANDGTTGTTANTLAKLTTAGAAIIAATTDTDGMIGVVTGGAGTTGNAQVAFGGQASCVFDAATTAGDFVSISTTTAGDCHDAGAARSTSSQTIGRVLTTNASGGTFLIELGMNGTAASGSGTTNYVARWTPNGTTLGIGVLYDNGTKVGIGTTSPTGLLSINSAATGAPYGVYATMTGASNTGYAGYFSNSSTSGYALYANGTMGAALVSGAAAPVTGVVAVTGGGTGDTTLTLNGVLYGNGTGAVNVTAQGGANTILTANSGAPSFSATPTINTSVTVPLVIGGTAASSALTLESTSGTGTSDSIIFKTGSQATAMTINSSGSVGIGSTGPIVSLDLSQKTNAVALPVGTTGTRPTGGALTNGELRYNSTTPALEAYINGAWATLSTSSGLTWPLAGAADTAGAPDYAWAAGTTTGLYYNTGIGFAVGGTGVGTVTSTGLNSMAIGATTASTGAFTTISATGPITDTQSIGATSTNGLVLTNTTAAATGAQQWSPRVQFDGRGWETGTGASQAVDMIEELHPVQGATNPSGNLTWSGSVNGGAYSALMTLTSGGNVGIGTTTIPDNLDVNGGIGLTTTTATLPTNGIYSPSANNLALTTNGAPAITVNSTGQVGVGTTSPASGVKEDIAGTVKVAGTGSETCSAATVGQIRYNPTGQYMEICTYP